jgi:hypothetical protein
MRKIHDQIKDQDWDWNIITNKEINLLIKQADIARCIKAQRIGWIESYCKNG